MRAYARNSRQQGESGGRETNQQAYTAPGNAGILLRHMHNWEFSCSFPPRLGRTQVAWRAIERSCNTLLLTTRSKVLWGLNFELRK